MTVLEILTGLAALSALAWVYLLLARHGFWRSGPELPPAAVDADAKWPPVAILIPARNEEETIGRVLAAHVAADYPGSFVVIAVDDGSTDRTRDIIAERVAEADGRIVLLDAPPLPGGWSGKLWALNTAIAHVDAVLPKARFVLLTDADIVHGPGSLTRLVARAIEDEAAMVSVMARLDARGVWGTLLVPAFVFFFQKLYPFRAVADPASAIAGGAGGCLLADRQVLSAVGGVTAVRDALIDDCALARLLKGLPPRRRLWLGFGDEVTSLRDNRRLATIWAMVARTAFRQLGRSWLALAGTVVGMAILYLVGPLALAAGLPAGNMVAAIAGALAWLLAAAAYLPTVRRYEKPPLTALTLPAAALLYTAMTVTSAIDDLRGRGGAWKGRTYGPPGPPVAPVAAVPREGDTAPR